MKQDIVQMIREDVEKTEKAIKTRVAIEYLADLMEERYRDAFLRAEKAARTPEDLASLLETAKTHIGQQAARELLDF